MKLLVTVAKGPHESLSREEQAKLREELLKTQPAQLKVKIEHEPEGPTETAPLSQAKTAEDKLRAYWALRGEPPVERQGRLLAKLAQIESSVLAQLSGRGGEILDSISMSPTHTQLKIGRTKPRARGTAIGIESVGRSREERVRAIQHGAASKTHSNGGRHPLFRALDGPLGRRLRNIEAMPALIQRTPAAEANQRDWAWSRLGWWRSSSRMPSWPGCDARAASG